MPLRGFFYFSQLYQIHIEKNKLNIHSSKLIKVPEPRFVVFYNGDRNKPDTFTLRLSDAFERKDAGTESAKKPSVKFPQDFEWTATVININPGRNSALQKNCKPLYDYVRYVGRITDNQKSGMPVKDAVDDAVNWAIDQDLLGGFFSINKAEVIAMCLTEFDVESAIKTWREDGYEDGLTAGKQEKAEEAARNLLKESVNTEIIARCTGLPLENVRKLAEELDNSTV